LVSWGVADTNSSLFISTPVYFAGPEAQGGPTDR
jgi:hypothetical protein